MKLLSYEIKKGVKLHYLQTEKFKTTNLSFFIHRPLLMEEVTKNALVSTVIRRGCKRYPTSMELSNALSDLYGASLDTGIKKKGDNQIVTISFSFANEKFVPGNPTILKDILSIADDLILNQEMFSEEYVNQEKENLKSLILAQKNDKRQYAQARCIEEMCKGEAYGIQRYGYVEKVDEITTQELYNHYKNIVLSSGVDIFICGDVDINFVKSSVENMYKDIVVLYDDYEDSIYSVNVDKVSNVTDIEPIAQGKLCIGFRTNTTCNDELYPALMMYNAILGSGIFSKLFNNVREKLSLCYYASSTVDYIKGVMFINSGIEVENFDKAYEEILKQMDDMKNGVISENELTAARLGTVNNIKSVTDSAFGTEDYYLSKIISGKMIDMDSLISLVNDVTIEQIVKVASGITLDTVYFLKGSEQN